MTNVCSIYSEGKGRATAATAPGYEPTKQESTVPDRTCSIDDCERAYLAQGMCSMHYQRGKAKGLISKLPPKEKRPCSAAACDRDAEGPREWCKNHWRLVEKYGVPDSPARPKPDQAWLDSIDVPPGSRAVPVLISRDKGFTYALVDEADYDDVMQWRWGVVANGYASRHSGDGRRYMHRYLMETPTGLDTDHINRNKLDNRRCNLRHAERSLNCFNQAPSRNNTSGHRGVGYFKPAKLWRAYITHQSQPKRIELGYFKTKEEAIAAREAAELEWFGECA